MCPVEAMTFPPTSGKAFIMGTDEAMESELGLGELAGLTVANEADSLGYDVSRKRQHELKRCGNISLQKTVSGVIETWKTAFPPSSTNL